MRLLKPAILVFLQICAYGICTAQHIDLKIPAAGNSFLTSGLTTGDSISDYAIDNWKSLSSVFSFYFRADTVASVKLGFQLQAPAGNSTIEVSVSNKRYALRVSGDQEQQVFINENIVLQPGYTKVDLKGISKTGEQFAHIANLILQTTAGEDAFNFVKENSGNRFYWGRRGPSLHLTYNIPPDKQITWFYNELRVPEGSDAIGSYFMANGFKEGYFGMQVNSETERRILFSVWSPSNAEDPSLIPDDEKVIMLKKGENVHAGEFGNEGAGGQSYLIYPWKSGNTYGFLTHAAPDNKGNTIYSAYFFAPEQNKWQFIASFRRPKTNTYLTRMHSFIENFIDTNGYLQRSCEYGNQWVLDTHNKWQELTQALFTGDDIANVQYRMDYKGGVTGNHFYLQNGGFINDPVKLKQYFSRPANNIAPSIAFSQLP